MAGKGYHNDQFFNLQGESPIRAGNGYKPIVADNPAFTYPSATIRTHDKHGVVTTQMKRGYIRSLVTKTEALSTGIRKCQFQFNPTPLQQSVNMATGMLNILQQDPAQFAQPFASSQNFVFSLMFDRSMEVNNDDGKFVIGDGTDIWRQNSPGQVGVLRDLAALYNTIGEGFSIQQRDYIAKVLKDTAKTEAANNSTGASDAAATATAQYNKAIANVDASLAGTDSGKGFLDINVGNAGFLLPIPVRVVFSSLYIVEGLVTNTSVVFTKFSSTMVPMQCNVTLTMEAKFIGFSKQHTFFTEVLEQREALQLADQQATVDAKNAIVSAFETACGTLDVGIYRSFQRRVDGVHSVYDPIYLSQVANHKGSTFKVGVSLPNSLGSSATPITDLLTAGSVTKISHGGTATVYGPFSSAVASLPQTTNLGTYAKANGSMLATGTHVPTNSNNGYAGAAKYWTPFATLSISEATFSSIMGSEDAPFIGPYDNQYFVVHYEGYMQVALASGDPIIANGDRWVVYGPKLSAASTNMLQGVQLSWPKATVPASGSGTVPPTNVSTAAPAAGSTGNTKPKTNPAPSSGRGGAI